MRIAPEIREALESCGKPYDLVRGTRHIKIKVDGRLAGILPHDGLGNSADYRKMKNIIAQVRRTARGVYQ